MNLDFGTVPTWVSGIGTVAAVSVALFQNQYTRRKQHRDELRAQADRISGWPDEDPSSNDPLRSKLRLLNKSDEPVYEVVVSVVLVQGAGPRIGEEVPPDWARNVFSILPPGQWVAFQPSRGGGMNRRPGVEIAFTDSRGRSWIRRATGAVQEIKKSPIAHYGLSLPQAFEIPSPHS